MAIGLAIVLGFAFYRVADRNAADNLSLAERVRTRARQRTAPTRLDSPLQSTRELPPADAQSLPAPTPAAAPFTNARQVRVPVSIGFESYSVEEAGPIGARAIGAGGDARGLIITHVYSDSPSAIAGLRDGDVLVAVDGQTIASRDHLAAILSRHAPQDVITVQLRSGRQVRVVLEPLMEVFPRACERGDAAACFAAGNRLRRGVEGVRPDSARAAALFERACSGGRHDACINLGRMLRRGEGIPADPARSAMLFDQACGAGVPEGCHNLAVLYRDGLGVGRDLERARQLAKSACAQGDEDACSPSLEDPE